MADEEVICDKCGESASGPGAADVIKRHKAEKHPAKKAAKNAGS